MLLETKGLRQCGEREGNTTESRTTVLEGDGKQDLGIHPPDK